MRISDWSSDVCSSDLAIPVMALVAIFVFMMLRLSPGDPAAILAGDQATAETIAAIRADLGLDRPIHEQFVVWVGELAQGNLGRSVLSRQPVTRMTGQRVARSEQRRVGEEWVRTCMSRWAP